MNNDSSKRNGRIKHRYHSGLNIFVRPGSAAESKIHRKAGLLFHRVGGEARVAGISATPAHDLVYRGGRTIPQLAYANFYVAGPGWDAGDVQNIDRALAAAMSDARLNNVLAQYFGGKAPTTVFAKSRLLQGAAPRVISRGDIDHLVQDAQASGALAGFDLTTTVFNFLLPPGTVLTDDADPSGGELKTRDDEDDERKGRGRKEKPAGRQRIADTDEDDKASSLEGLGGYHGSVHLGNKKVYFAVGVYSQTLADGSSNGIVAFDKPWKNVVATLYHELCEARTDPDVEEANNTGNEALVGWTSAQGEEIGDFPIFEDPSLTHVFKEVPLANGQGIVPVQFQYSNAVHGPEGPIPTPHPASGHALAHVAAHPLAMARAASAEATWNPVTEPGRTVKRVPVRLSGTRDVFVNSTMGDLGLPAEEVQTAMNTQCFPSGDSSLSMEQCNSDASTGALT